MVFKPLENGLNRFKQTSNCSNFNWSKKDLPELKQFEIKYFFEDLGQVNNFLRRSFFRFRMDLELKFREVSRLEINRI
jgi:hypothetical protein